MSLLIKVGTASWTVLSALDPLVAAGKLGLLLFQFPPWFTIRRANSDKWTSKDIHEKSGYLYSTQELAEWAPRI